MAWAYTTEQRAEARAIQAQINDASARERNSRHTFRLANLQRRLARVNRRADGADANAERLMREVVELNRPMAPAL